MKRRVKWGPSVHYTVPSTSTSARWEQLLLAPLLSLCLRCEKFPKGLQDHVVWEKSPRSILETMTELQACLTIWPQAKVPSKPLWASSPPSSPQFNCWPGWAYNPSEHTANQRQKHLISSLASTSAMFSICPSWVPNTLTVTPWQPERHLSPAAPACSNRGLSRMTPNLVQLEGTFILST